MTRKELEFLAEQNGYSLTRAYSEDGKHRAYCLVSDTGFAKSPAGREVFYTLEEVASFLKGV